MRPLPRLRRFVLPATALVAALAGTLAVAPPASADVTGTTQTGDVVLYQHCQQHPISYSLVDTGGLLQLGFRVELQVFSPDGRTSEGSVLNSATNPPLTGTVNYTFCGSETAGTWTVRGTVRTYPVNTVVGGLPDSTFTVRAPATRTDLTKKHVGHRKNKLVARVLEETESGFAKAEGITLQLQKRTSSGWQRVPRVLTTAHGKAATVVKGRGTYRVVVPARNNVGGSESGPVSVH